MDVAWGGIWGHVFLEARSDCFLNDLFVQPDAANSSCSASATLSGKADLADSAKLEIFDKSGDRVAEASLKIDPKTVAGQAIAVKATIRDAKLWSPDSPTLYNAKLSLLKGNEALDAVETRFGMRQFTTDGYRLLLNGKRIMLCGYGDDHIYPEQMAMPSDKELHLKRLRIIKSYGFTHVRHHSTIMPPEYYDACDEVGIITTAEFPIAYEPFIPGTGARWKANVKPGTDPKPVLDTYHREWTAAITRHRNHPCILCWVVGNELYPDFPIRYSFRDIAKGLDPLRLYLDSDGVDAALLGNPKLDRPTVAIYDIQFAEWADPVVNVDKFKSAKPVKPVISHETSNYTTFSRTDLVDQFQHNVKPFWLTDGKVALKTTGLTQEANLWALKSERLYLTLQKANFETLRKNPYISGYHWWLFQDYWTSSNGIVDHYFRPKSITREEVLRFNNAVVLLQDGLDRTYRGKSRFALKLLVSNFSSDPLSGELAYEVKTADRSLAAKQLPLKQVPQGDVAEAARIGFDLPDVREPTKLTITAKLSSGETTFANDWTTWLYPAKIRPAASKTPVFADEIQMKHCRAYDAKPIPEKGDLDSHAVYVVSWSNDSRVTDAMKRGASVVALDGGERLMKSCKVTFRTTWWKAGDTPEANNCGTFVYDHPTTRAMSPDGWCDDGWFYLLEGAAKCVFGAKYTRPEVIIRALPGMVRVEDSALLFEVGVGRGSLIVSGLNHRQAAGRPENQWLIARLIDRAAEFTKPKAQWPMALFNSLPGVRVDNTR